MRVRLTVTKYQKNMVKYNSKVICVSKGEIYLLVFKLQNENGEVLTFYEDVREAIRKALDEYENHLRESGKVYKMTNTTDAYSIHSYLGSYGWGFVISSRTNVDASMIASGLNKQIARSLAEDCNVVVD